jgi:hypothetical protein
MSKHVLNTRLGRRLLEEARVEKVLVDQMREGAR